MRKVLLGLLAVLVLMVLMVPSVSADWGLKYDDGDPETGHTGVVGVQYAVRFSLPLGWTSAKILTARYYILSSPTAFKVHVYASDKTDLITPFSVTPSATYWFNVDLTGLSIVVSGDFYIAIEFLTEGSPRIGGDTNAPIDVRTYPIDETGTWLSPWGQTDLMIRAIVEPPELPVGGLEAPINTLALLAPWIIMILATSFGTILAAKRKRKH